MRIFTRFEIVMAALALIFGTQFVFASNLSTPHRKLTPSEIKELAKAKAEGGGMDGGGGNDVGLEVRLAFESAARQFKLPPLDIANDSIKAITPLFEETQIIATNEKLFVNIAGSEQECVAKSFPDKKIVLVNITRWKQIKDDLIKESIALHEALVIARVERTGYYPISRVFLQVLGIGSTAVLSSGMPDFDESKPMSEAETRLFNKQKCEWVRSRVVSDLAAYHTAVHKCFNLTAPGMTRGFKNIFLRTTEMCLKYCVEATDGEIRKYCKDGPSFLNQAQVITTNPVCY